MSEKKAKRSHPRRAVGYLTTGNKSFLVKYTKDNNMSESQAVNEAIRLLKASIAPFSVKK